MYEINKIVIAPQIVVYKNVLSDPKDILETFLSDHEGSLFTPKRQWYSSGYRKECLFNKKDNEHSKLFLLNKERQYLAEIADAIEFIKKDYFDNFNLSNGIWPNFITEWNKVISPQENYEIDFFEYVVDISGSKVDGKYLMMDYHVDDFLIENEKKDKCCILTINFYLNDDYDDGEICAYDLISDKSYAYKPAAGDIVVMPSTAPFYHGVMSYTKNNRYFVRNFIKYDLSDDVIWIDMHKNIKNLNDKEIVYTEEDYIKNDMQTIKVNSETIVVSPNLHQL